MTTITASACQAWQADGAWRQRRLVIGPAQAVIIKLPAILEGGGRACLGSLRHAEYVSECGAPAAAADVSSGGRDHVSRAWPQLPMVAASRVTPMFSRPSAGHYDA